MSAGTRSRPVRPAALSQPRVFSVKMLWCFSRETQVSSATALLCHWMGLSTHNWHPPSSPPNPAMLTSALLYVANARRSGGCAWCSGEGAAPSSAELFAINPSKQDSFITCVVIVLATGKWMRWSPWRCVSHVYVAQSNTSYLLIFRKLKWDLNRHKNNK